MRKKVQLISELLPISTYLQSFQVILLVINDVIFDLKTST